ncbi:hypothetical protein [Vibrio sp. 10N.261.46.A3]|uniref:hypothetical protein n=1 Tax=Vibrio sp. 10N.261.46.A3 TaxID=3229658 RepID=UPI00354BCE2A
MWLGKKEKLKADARCERADTSKRDSGCEELEEHEKQIRVNEIRDAKGKNKEGDSLVFRSSLLVYPHLASALICFSDHNFYLFPLGFFHIAPTYWVTPCQSWQLSN